MKDITTIRLNTGQRMPVVALGTFLIDSSDVEAVLRNAIDAGCRHIDAAWMYDNEEAIGVALQKIYKEGKVRREDLFITTKLWATHNDPADVMSVFLKTLKKLQTDYVDSYLMHVPAALAKGETNWPKDENGKSLHDEGIHYVDTWKAMEKLYREGMARSIGISNFNEYQIKKLLQKCSIVPSVHQVESHPYHTQEPMLKLCKENDITMTSYAALGGGGRPWAAGEPVVLEEPLLKEIAEKHGKTTAQVAIRYQIQRGVPTIWKSINPERIIGNMQVFDFELTPSEMDSITGLDKGLRYYLMEWFLEGHKYWAHRENYSEE